MAIWWPDGCDIANLCAWFSVIWNRWRIIFGNSMTTWIILAGSALYDATVEALTDWETAVFIGEVGGTLSVVIAILVIVHEAIEGIWVSTVIWINIDFNEPIFGRLGSSSVFLFTYWRVLSFVDTQFNSLSVLIAWKDIAAITGNIDRCGVVIRNAYACSDRCGFAVMTRYYTATRILNICPSRFLDDGRTKIASVAIIVGLTVGTISFFRHIFNIVGDTIEIGVTITGTKLVTRVDAVAMRRGRFSGINITEWPFANGGIWWTEVHREIVIWTARERVAE